jgi:hypothetical protein
VAIHLPVVGVNTLDFLRAILPDRGLYVAARLINGKFKNQPCDSIDELTQEVLGYDAGGASAYFAVASYRNRSVATTKPDGSIWHQVRTHANVRACKSFWMDLDVEPGNLKKFESQEDAIDGLVSFCNTTHLPLPMVVSSGGGIHVYWGLTNEILPEQWKQTAESLKRLAAHHQFRADPACTSDLARVLRPVGTVNRKIPNAPKLVELIAESAPCEFGRFKSLVDDALKLSGIKPPEAVRQVEAKGEALNQQFAVTREFPPCSGRKVAERCKQLGAIRDSKGNVSEPVWYAGIQLLCSSIEGDALIHEWSAGHPAYSVDQTNGKIAQVRGQQLGPTLCATFESRNPGGCEGCPFLGKISSPAQLGTYVAPAPPPVVTVEVAGVVTSITLPNPPNGFTRGIPKTPGQFDGGIFVEEDGITHCVYEYDCFPVELAYDEALGFETTRWRHWLPKEGWKECVLQSSLIARPADFMAKLIDNHIQPLIKGKFIMYGDAYIRKLRTDTKLRQLFKSQGWKDDDTAFVLGDKLYRKDEVIQAGFSHGMSEFLSPFHAKGNLDTWRTLTEVFDHPGLEPHAFMLLLAFASPLLKLAGREGCTINALGDSGVGKSTMAQFMSSVYGSPKGAWVGRKDTELARMQRLGAHYNLPVYMDEATTIPNKDLRDLVYSIPTGKNRSSMRQDYTLRKGAEWVTLFVTSTNNSLQTKLQIENANAEAESLRLFEFTFPRIEAFAEIAKIIPGVIQANYGVAGPAYIQYLVRNREQILTKLTDVVGDAERAFGMDDKERFWSQVTALALYGGQLAREAGVINFNPDRLRPWLLQETRRMRNVLDDSTVGPVAVLANYLNEHVGERMVVTNANKGMAAVSVKPYHEVSQRYEPETKTLWISWKSVKNYIDKGHFNLVEVQDDLIHRGILLDARASRTLGAGTDFTSGPVRCWRVNAGHEELEGVL